MQVTEKQVVMSMTEYNELKLRADRKKDIMYNIYIRMNVRNRINMFSDFDIDHMGAYPVETIKEIEDIINVRFTDLKNYIDNIQSENKTLFDMYIDDYVKLKSKWWYKLATYIENKFK